MTYSAHQLELLADVHMSDDPVTKACKLLRRWDYWGQVARGVTLDIALSGGPPDVREYPELYIQRSNEACQVLRDYLQGLQPSKAS